MPPRKRVKTDPDAADNAVKEEKKEEEEEDREGESSRSLEQLRLDNMKRNMEFLANIGLDGDKAYLQSNLAPLTATSGPSRRGQGSVVKKVAVPAEPVRRSGRITSERLKTEIEDLKAGGGVDATVLEAKEQMLQDLLAKKIDPYQAAIDAEGEDNYARLPSDPIPLKLPLNASAAEKDEEGGNDGEKDGLGKPIIDILKSQSASVSSYFDRNSDADYISSMKKLRVAEEDVAKMTETRITAVAFHPSKDKLITMAGDKLGYIGIWDVNSSSAGMGGVYKYRPHIKNVATIHTWNEEPSKVYSVSYDGTIRFIDLEKEAFCQCFEAPDPMDDYIFSDAAFSPYNNYNILVGLSDGRVNMIDVRNNNAKQSYAWSKTAQDGSKINSVQFHPLEEHLVVCGGSGKFGSITVHDMRKSNSGFNPLAKLDLHSKSINAAYLSPDAEYLVSVSLDNTVRATRNFMSENPVTAVLRHDNNTGRWLSTFRPSFDPKRAHTFVLGSMDRPRRVEIFSFNNNSSSSSASSSSGSKKGAAKDDSIHPINLLHAVQGEYLASVCSRNCFHPSLNIIAAGNSSGRLHILR